MWIFWVCLLNQRGEMNLKTWQKRTRTPLRNIWSCSQGTSTHLHLIHPVHNVQHFLENLLQPKVHLQPLSPCPEQLQKILPQADNIVLPCSDAFDVMVVFSLKLLRHRHHGLNPLLVCRDVCLDGLVLLRGSLHCWEVKAKIVLQRQRHFFRNGCWGQKSHCYTSAVSSDLAKHTC